MVSTKRERYKNKKRFADKVANLITKGTTARYCFKVFAVTLRMPSTTISGFPVSPITNIQ
jgi:hypothetical protein